ncbi:MAG: nitroreductase family protein [Desulfobacterales bacterium]|jgi:nitroreductase/NAD-dependent dihydropyrimidine dehydrogenase PreA subunit|nr:nitroreductase family protein [Desulfobacterales bacterium]
MIKLVIDPTRCAKENFCIDECPRQIIRLNNETGLPEIKPGHMKYCILCGHCIAVCPHSALEHTQIPKDACPPVDAALAINKAQMIQFFRVRRSARVFKDTPVEKEKIQALIDIAKYAPTANNSQMLEWIVLTDKEQVTGLAATTIEWMRSLIQIGPQAIYSPYVVPLVAAWDKGYDRVLKNAPVLIFATAPAEAFYGMTDSTIALSHLELAAPSVGLSTCWAGLLHRAMVQYEPLRAYVGLSADYPHFYPMMLGYSKHQYHRLPERKPPTIHWR